MSPTRLAVLAYVTANQPAKRKDVAAAIGAVESTASVHLKALVKAGLLHRWRIDSSLCAWSATPKPPPVAVRPVARHALRAHEQVSSVWEYARRCA
jgi:DNA-binding transcriptional ArsR family regulator